MDFRLTSTILLSLSLLGCGRGLQEGGVTDSTSPAIAEPESGSEAVATTARAGGRQRVLLGSAELTSGIRGEGPVTSSEIDGWLANAANHEPLELAFPMWLDAGAGQAKDLKDNPMTRAKIELGRQLFFDKRLSADDSVSCASCHEPEKGYAVGTPVATGIGGQAGRRNPPTLLNRIMLSVGDDKQFWDGRSESVEDALLHALADPTEMAATPDAITEKLNSIAGYRKQFARIYGEVSWSAVGDAMGCFVRCLVTGPSLYDYALQWRIYEGLDAETLQEDRELAIRHAQAKGDMEAHPLSEGAVRGEYLFFGNRAWCSACHTGVNFTDELYHNIGIGMERDDLDLGRYEITGEDKDWGAFKTPTIRGAVYTAPYMHDGSLATLEDVVEWYAHEGRDNRNLDYRFRRIEGEELSEQDKKDLVEFVRACSGRLPVVETGRLPE